MDIPWPKPRTVCFDVVPKTLSGRGGTWDLSREATRTPAMS